MATNSTDSVIGKLMGFDDMWAPQKPSHGKDRVLSESYVYNSASVGLQPGSFVLTGLSHRTKHEIVHQMKDEFGLHISKGKNSDIPDKCIKSSASKVEKGLQSHGSGSRHALKYLQKHDPDSLSGHLGTNYLRKSLGFSHDTNTATKQHYIEHGDSFKRASGKGLPYVACNEMVVNGIMSCRNSCGACTRYMSRISQQVKPRSKFDELFKIRHMGDSGDKHLVDEFEGLVLSSPEENDFKGHSLSRDRSVDKFSLANVTRKNKFERSKAAKEVQEVEIHVRGQDCGEMFPLADSKSPAQNNLCIISILNSRNSGSCNPSAYSLIDFWEDGYKKSLPIFKFEAIKKAISSAKQDETTARSNCLVEQMISQNNILEPKNGIWISTASSRDPDSETVPVILSAKREHSSHIQGICGEERLLNECSEEESTYSNCSRESASECLNNLKRTYQQSPHSVLEQFDVQNFSSSENFDRIDFGSEKTYSEGSAVLISGDEGFEFLDDRSNNAVYDGGLIKAWLGDTRSRNYSYMIDVLDEAGFCGVECSISPLVFMTLEKKYGKQTNWTKSERQLLFDHINAGLVSISNTSSTSTKFFSPKQVEVGYSGENFHDRSNKICSPSRRDEVAEELWMMLTGREEETCRGLPTKALDKWCEREEGIDIVCEELGNMLFDELVMESDWFSDFDE